VGNAHRDDRSPAVSLLDNHVDVGELVEVSPAGGSVGANNLVDFGLSPAKEGVWSVYHPSTG
jgi:hypothetical protein